MDKIVELPGIQIQDLTTGSDQPLEKVTWKIPQGGELRTFGKAIQFTPTGEARVKIFGRVVQFEVLPVRGDALNSAVVSMMAITGKTKITHNR